MTKIEKIARILELAEIPFEWLKKDGNGNGISLSLEDGSSTVSLMDENTLRVFLSSDVSFSTYEQSDIGDALRIIMESRYMLRVDGPVKISEKDEWIE